MKDIVIVDYGAGNLKSIENMLESFGCSYIITEKKEDIIKANRVIFPGQGHFGRAMQCLNEKGLTQTLKDVVNNGVPFLGICVGHQLLFESSEEAPEINGLGIFKGKNVRFTEGKVPQIGWNKLKTTSNNSILTDDYVYFVNSYYVKAEDESIISAYSNYHVEFMASVEYKNVIGLQFHPEKSGQVGYNAVEKWLKLGN